MAPSIMNARAYQTVSATFNRDADPDEDRGDWLILERHDHSHAGNGLQVLRRPCYGTSASFTRLAGLEVQEPLMTDDPDLEPIIRSPPPYRRPETLFLAVFGLLLASIVTGFAADPETDRLLDLTRAAREESRFAESESLATAARDRLMASADHDTLQIATAWWEIAESRYQRRLTADTLALHAGLESLRLFETAGPRGRLGAALAHQTIGTIYSITRRSAQGLEEQRTALAIHRAELGDEHERTTESFYRVGAALARVNQPDSALAIFEAALPVRRRLDKPRDRLIGDFLSEMGQALEMKGEEDRAEKMYAEGILAHEEEMGPEDAALARSLNMSGSFAFRHGDYVEAFEELERAAAILEKTRGSDNSDRLTIVGNLATGYVLIGDYRRARRLYEEMLPKQIRIMGDKNPTVLTHQIGLANAYRALGDTLASLSLMARIRSVFEADTNRTDRDRYATVLFNEGDLRRLLGEDQLALDLATRCQRLVKAGATTDRKLLMRALLLAHTANAWLGNWDEVDRLSGEIDGLLDLTTPRDPRMVAFAATYRCPVEFQRGRHERAVSLASEASEIEREALLQAARSLSDRQALQLSGTLSESLEHLLMVAGLSTDPSAVRKAWEELVGWRGLVRHVITQRRAPPGLDTDPAMQEAHESWLLAQRDLARFEVRTAGTERDSAASMEAARLQASVDDADRRWARAYPSAAIEDDPGAVTLDSVLGTLPANAVLVAFAQAMQPRAEPRLVAFIGKAGGERVQSLDLGPVSRIAALVEDWRQQLAELDPQRRSDTATIQTGESLRRAIWDPILSHAGDVRLVAIVPEAPLLGLPWGALPQPSARDRFLVEGTPEIRVLDAERDLLPRELSTQSSLLAVGGVDFDNAPESLADPKRDVLSRGGSSPCSDSSPDRMLPLPGTRAEIQTIAALLFPNDSTAKGNTILLEDSIATEATFKELAGGHSIIHLATHGVAPDDTCGRGPALTRGVGGVGVIAPAKTKPARVSPEIMKPTATQSPSTWSARNVFLAFANANHAGEHHGSENDGLLTALEVETLNLRGTDWVVLSACRSAEGEARTREGVLGMQRAFRLAGARSVIASQWSVADDATLEWMRALYQSRASGVTDPARAITNACRSVLADRRSTGRSTHPFYWAAFTASGQ
jgi:CHAT domain-containing protein/tetratricopeptide (TPR) repeat protein